MARNEPLAGSMSPVDRRLRLAAGHPHDLGESRTIVIRQGSTWQATALLLLSLLLGAVVLLGQDALRRIDARHQQGAAVQALAERKIQQLEAGLSFDARRRQQLLGIRDHILRVNARVAVADAYLYARLAVEAGEKYPSVDPLLLVAIGTVESGYDAQARSSADARGLYQIWPSTGRLLARSLGWDYDDQTLYDPQKNTEAAALYLDILFAAYVDPQLVLAEYNGGPLNAGYYRASVGALAAETRQYVPRVIELYGRLKQQFETGTAPPSPIARSEGQREGRSLGARSAALLNRTREVTPEPAALPTPVGRSSARPSRR